MNFSSYELELPDYSIQQVEQAEYQLPAGFGETAVSSLLKKPLTWVLLLVITGLIYHKVA